MRTRILAIILILFSVTSSIAQEELSYSVFKNQPINFGGEKGIDSKVIRLQDGRIIYKKVTVLDFSKGTDVKIKVSLRSNGDRWDKSGSCFIVMNPDDISIINVTEGENEFTAKSTINEKFKGVKATDAYKPAVELLRFMTPFGVGFYSNDKGKHRKPVYIPVWEKQVVWEQDISQLKTYSQILFIL